jgi:hypothetical protein
MRKIVILIIFSAIISCTGKPDECGKNEVVDRRFRTFPSQTMALCISEKCNGEDGEICCTGVVKDGECLSEVKPGEKCSIISDCGKDAPICLTDPMIVETFIDKGSQMGIELTSEDLTQIFGLNYCTVMNCDPNPEKPFDKENPVHCPGNMVCSDDLAGISTGVYICKNETETEETTDEDETVDEDEVFDDEELDDTDTESEYACMGDPCENHSDCKEEGCVATFCTAELGMFLPEGAPEVCVMRCDPANSGSDCPEDLECNGQVAMLGDAADGAKGICVTPGLTTVFAGGDNE